MNGEHPKTEAVSSNPSAAPDVEYAITLMGCWARDEKPCGPAGAAKLALTSLEYLKGEIERLTRERNEAREHTSTAAFMRVEAERDEWAEKWHRLRAELAELKYPGMKGVVRPLSGEPESAHETCERRVVHTIGELSDLMRPGFEALPFDGNGWHELSVRIKRNENGSLGLHMMTFVPERGLQPPSKASGEPT